MAVLAAAALLDELMGRNRNILPHEKVKELNWEDPEYCKYFMVKFCPHDLFVNTKADLGACAKVHDEEIRKIFVKAKGHRKLQYQEDFLRCCSQMVNDVERRIQKGKQRLSLSNNKEATLVNPAQVQRNEEQIDILNDRINGLEKEAEEAGNNGNVEQAQGLMKLCDQLKDERDQLKKFSENGHRSATAELVASQEKLMEVCEVCGAFLIVGDAQQRIEDHLMGKQHMGYIRKLKLAIEEIAAVVQATRDERKAKSDKKDIERDRNDSAEVNSREYERSYHREHRDRSEHRFNNDRGVDRRDKDKERSERRNSCEHRHREHKQKEWDRDRRHHDTGREYRSHHHSSSHRRY